MEVEIQYLFGTVEMRNIVFILLLYLFSNES